MQQTPRLNRKRQETLTGDAEHRLASACSLDEISTNITAGQTCVNDSALARAMWVAERLPATMVASTYILMRLHAWLNLLCGNECSAQPNLTTRPECRRYNVHAELFRQKNKYAEKRKERLLEVRGAAERRCETGKPSCFRNLKAPLLRTSNTCLYEGAITQFQDLAFCINKVQLTRYSDDVRLISTKCKFGAVCV